MGKKDTGKQSKRDAEEEIGSAKLTTALSLKLN
jgi:hypothetical protein